MSTARPPINTEHDVLRFIDCVYEPTDIVELRCLRSGVAQQSWCNVVSLIDSMDWLIGLNDDGWNIYCGANPRPAVKASGDDCIELLRCFFVDFDGGTTPGEADERRIAAGLPQPTMTVFSGHGTHFYWRLLEPITDLAYWTTMQKRLITALDSDKSIHNPERIMRLPGFMNVKSEPHVRCYVVDADCNRVYDLVDFLLPELEQQPKHDQNGHAYTTNEQLVRRARAYINTIPNGATGERNAGVYRVAAILVNDYCLPESDALALLREWNAGHGDPLDDTELVQTLDNASRYANKTAGSKTESKTWAEHHRERPVDNKQPQEPIIYRQFTCAELDGGDFDEEFLIRDVLVANQPLVISGPRKGLKTSLLADLALSLATATPFLGQFHTTRHVRTVFMSGESGMSTLQKTARAVAEHKGFALAKIEGLIWSPDLPKFGHIDHMDALLRYLKKNAAEVCLLDPAYLCLVDDKPGELSARGALIRSVSDVCNDAGCMLGIAHHYNRAGATSFEEPSLDWISGSAFAEFMRQWLLTGRRAKYAEGSGLHQLWLSVGGSAGHSSLWGLNIDEGVFPQRLWQPTLMGPDEVRECVHEARSAAKDAEKRSEIEKDKNAILRIIAQANGKLLCKTEVQERYHRNKQKFNAAFAELADEGSIVAEQFRNTQNKLVNGWKLRPDDPD